MPRSVPRSVPSVTRSVTPVTSPGASWSARSVPGGPGHKLLSATREAAGGGYRAVAAGAGAEVSDHLSGSPVPRPAPAAAAARHACTISLHTPRTVSVDKQMLFVLCWRRQWTSRSCDNVCDIWVCDRSRGGSRAVNVVVVYASFGWSFLCSYACDDLYNEIELLSRFFIRTLVLKLLVINFIN